MRYETSVLIVNEELQILATRDGRALTLPQVSVEGGRAGIALSRAVREQLGLEVFGLVLPPLTARTPQPLRTQTERVEPPHGYLWADPAELEGEAQRISSSISEVSVADTRFARFAWYSEVQEWLKVELGKRGYRVCTLEQWNGRVGGVLLRVVTNGPPFWFKAVSDFNAREIGIVHLLAAKHPHLFPQIVASEPAWGAFLLEHVEGRELYDCDDLATWTEVAEQLAGMQIDWVGPSEDLLAVGAADLRAESMTSRIPGFLDHVDDAMARQPKTPPGTLIRADLDHLADLLYWLCGEVPSLPFANGLANADFSPHNTLITHRGPMFIDWAEACISLPLIAGEYMWNRMAVESPDRRGWQTTLRKAYLGRWARRYGAGPVGRASELLPAFSLFAVAMFYHEREHHGPSPYDSYLRSLARKLHGEARKLLLPSLALQA
jgi:hypothetical protein